MLSISVKGAKKCIQNTNQAKVSVLTTSFSMIDAAQNST